MCSRRALTGKTAKGRRSSYCFGGLLTFWVVSFVKCGGEALAADLGLEGGKALSDL